MHESNFSTDSLVDGYEFCATLDTHTPLKVLEHHGEIRREPRSKLPEYGDSRDGIWFEFLEDYSSRPSNEDLRDLEFLKKFRKIYEGDLSHQRKREAISALIEEYHDVRLTSFARDWYLWELWEIPGVSTSIAEVLYSEGIKTKENVKVASDEELLSIPGIGPGRLRQIRAYFSRSAGDRTNG
jgi:hypothetical protein